MSTSFIAEGNGNNLKVFTTFPLNRISIHGHIFGMEHNTGISFGTHNAIVKPSNPNKTSTKMYSISSDVETPDKMSIANNPVKGKRTLGN